ncbi:MAG: PIN domain-containing protein [Myxococcota bacterium]
MRMVLDASVAVAAARPNEPSHGPARSRIVQVLGGHDDIAVPAIFPIEVAASLARVGEPIASINAYVDALMSVATVSAIGPRRARRIREIAMVTKLRGADAIYVWLANHEYAPLCTLDREMAQRGSAVCQIISP